MALQTAPFTSGFRTPTAALADALLHLPEEDLVSLPLLDRTARQRLCAASASLSFRLARPVVGEGERAVYQDFTICMDVPWHSLLWRFAAALERHINAALRLCGAPLLRPEFHINDLAIQRYERGGRGITPHRDHVRYDGLVAVVPLSGAARFCVCADRVGGQAREVPAPPGNLLLMRAPGFAGRSDRPFHFVADVTRRRLSLGLRHDTRRPPRPDAEASAAPALATA